MTFLLRLLRQIPPLLTGLVQSLMLCTPHSSTPMDFSSESLVMGSHSVHLREESGLAQDRGLVTIDKLPDDVLVEIFFYVNDIKDWSIHNPWHALVHVCRRWRYLVFASPRHLNLRLEYRGHRPMSEVLDAWPVLPISLISTNGQSDQRWDNTVAALESEHSNRISEIHVDCITNLCWESFTAAMQKPFPELKHLDVWTLSAMPVFPDSFLGGSAQHLRTLALGGITFPSSPKLLLSANRLVEFSLWGIPDSGYFPSDTMATTLAVMTRLEILRLRFRSPRSRPNPASRSLPPSTRFVLPALTQLIFKGVYEDLEDLLARIDPPHLYHLDIIFFMTLDIDVPQLHWLIGHAEEFKTFTRASVWIYYRDIRLALYPNTVEVNDHRRLELRIECREVDRQLALLSRVCSSSWPLISALEELQIWEDAMLSSSHWKDNMENAQWLELLDSFTALKNIYLTHGIATHFCGALQELSAGRAIEVLPALRNLFVRGFSSLEPVQEAMKPFIAERQRYGHPVVVDHWTN